MKETKLLNIFKHKKDHTRFMYLHPAILMIMFDAQNWALEHGMPFIVTSTVSTHKEDIILSRKSSAHRDGRAWDMSIVGWSHIDVIRLINYINTQPHYKKYHYLSNQGLSRIAYRHDSGHGDHVHFAIHSRFKRNILIAEQ